MAHYICIRCGGEKDDKKDPPVGTDRWLPGSNICPDCEGKPSVDVNDFNNDISACGEEQKLIGG